MIGHQMPFLNPTFFAAGKIVEYASKRSLQMSKKCFFAMFRCEYDMALALSCRMIQVIEIL
ncbi:Hypothetical protein BROD_1913 [Brucella sp. NF 2653]|nr:Hypothetical protein BROD_1913 [Brucella sp. NF 2653]